uniref:Uncharacterized protein n=1 Tax=Pelusios castaneus TaxID=367368 RepID=A0A8C8RZ98_9SAUR
MREPNRTSKRRNLLLILHPNRIPSSSSCPKFPPHQQRHSIPYYTPTKPPNHLKLMDPHNMMNRHTHCIYSKNTAIRITSMTPKSTCRSPYCRIHNLSRSTS